MTLEGNSLTLEWTVSRGCLENRAHKGTAQGLLYLLGQAEGVLGEGIMHSSFVLLGAWWGTDTLDWG